MCTMTCGCRRAAEGAEVRVGQAVLRMTLRELKAELRHRHMKVGGLKLTLQLRLQATIDGASPTNTNTPAPDKMPMTQ